MTRNYAVPSPSRVLSHVAAVARETGVHPAAILSSRRTPAVLAARWAVWRELHELDGFGFAPIARAWGCDHTTVMNAKRRGWGLESSVWINPRVNPVEPVIGGGSRDYQPV